MCGNTARDRRPASGRYGRNTTVVMNGVEYRLDMIASWLAHGHPDLSGRLEPLDPVRHQDILAELAEAVTTALWREHRCLSRDVRLRIAREYFGCTVIEGNA